MDNFIDKLAQKFTAGEVIRANSMAEAREMKRLQKQVEEYETCLQEMRKVQMKNTEAANQLSALVADSSSRMEAIANASLDKIAEASVNKKETILLEEIEKEVENLRQAMQENQDKTEELFRQADDYLHKENVKVYRNVQAVIVDELNAKTEAMTTANEETVKKYSGKHTVLLILILLGVSVSLILQIFNTLTMYGIKFW